MVCAERIDELQVWLEPQEVIVEGVQSGIVFDGKGGQVSVGRQIPSVGTLSAGS
jgi:hypothetical protein